MFKLLWKELRGALDKLTVPTNGLPLSLYGHTVPCLMSSFHLSSGLHLSVIILTSQVQRMKENLPEWC